MTDNEIIKALECCKTSDSDSCKKCPLYNGNNPCKENLDEHIFELIKRLQTKNSELLIGMKILKRKAQKDLSEKLYEKIEQNSKFGFAYVTKKEIENVVRELEEIKERF
jgi:hypothetical protein